MTQYDTWNIKFSNSQLNILKLGIKNGTKVTNNVGDSNNENNFLHNMLLSNTQIA